MASRQDTFARVAAAFAPTGGAGRNIGSVTPAKAPQPTSFALDAHGRRAFWELRHARLRLAKAENNIAWAMEAMVSGYINPDAALQVLDETMDEIAGAVE